MFKWNGDVSNNKKNIITAQCTSSFLLQKKVNKEQLDTYKIKLLRGCFVGRRKKRLRHVYKN
jgi:hypothetical protein